MLNFMKVPLLWSTLSSLVPCNHFTDFNDTWQEGSTECYLPIFGIFAPFPEQDVHISGYILFFKHFSAIAALICTKTFNAYNHFLYRDCVLFSFLFVFFFLGGGGFICRWSSNKNRSSVVRKLFTFDFYPKPIKGFQQNFTESKYLRSFLKFLQFGQIFPRDGSRACT